MRLSSHDASFLYSESASGPMHGVGITVVEGDLEFERFLQFCEERLHLVPRYRERLAFVPGNVAHPKWIDDPFFNIRNHIVKHDVPPGTTFDAAVAIALELGEALLDRNRPLWKTVVIEGVEGNTLLAQMAHHAMIDGASGVEIGAIMMDFEPNPPPVEPPGEPWNPRPLETPFELWTEAQREVVAGLTVNMMPQASIVDAELLAKGNAIMQRMMTRPVMTTPWNAAPVGPKRTLAWTKHQLDDFRHIKNLLGGTINDVVLAVVTEAAARYMQANGEQVEGQHIRLMCPVNVREEGDDELGNKVSALYPVLPAWPMGIQERLQAVRTEMDELKSNDEARALHALMNSSGNASPSLMSPTLAVGTPFDPGALAARFPAPVPPRIGPRPPYFGFNFTVTNVPGIPQQTYIAGHKVLYTIGTMMIGGLLGLGVSCGSANGEMVICMTAEPRLLPDVERLKEGVEGCLGELTVLANARGDTRAAEA